LVFERIPGVSIFATAWRKRFFGAGEEKNPEPATIDGSGFSVLVSRASEALPRNGTFSKTKKYLAIRG
jgi:hypothetical protein